MRNTLKTSLFIVLTFIIAIGSGCKKKTKNSSSVIETGTVMDIDSNIYKTVKIGDQWWMAENLNVTKFNDGTSILEIPTTENDSVWAKNNLSAVCLIDKRYGRLYNWSAVSDAKKIAPKGWHIPTDEEWKKLEQQIGMSSTDTDKLAWRGSNLAGKLFPLNSIGWPTTSAVFGTDDFGFSALPGGCRVFDGSVNTESNTAFWWTATENGAKAYYRYIDYNNTNIYRQSTYKAYGFSIRCVKD